MISAWRRRARLVAMLVVAVGTVGFVADAFSGLPLARAARSWPASIVGVLALGALSVLGEAVGEWIVARDIVSQPLVRRLRHLASLLGVGLVFAVAAEAVLRMTR